MNTLIPIIVCVVSGVVCLIGLAIPYWVNWDAGLVTYHGGLWSVCIGDICGDYGDSAPAYIDATRAFELIGLFAVGGAVLVALLKMLCCKEKFVLTKLAGVLALIAGGSMILGCIIFGAKVEHNLHAGFALCVISAIGSIVGGILFFINRA